MRADKPRACSWEPRTELGQKNRSLDSRSQRKLRPTSLMGRGCSGISYHAKNNGGKEQNGLGTETLNEWRARCMLGGWQQHGRFWVMSDGVFYRAVKSSEGERKADSPEVVMAIPHILTVLCKSCAPWDTGGETSPSWDASYALLPILLL